MTSKTSSSDQAYHVVYVTSESVGGDLSKIRAVQKVASLWAKDAREALALFDLHPPKNVHSIAAIQPAQVDRAGWIEASDEERRRVAGSESRIIR